MPTEQTRRAQIGAGLLAACLIALAVGGVRLTDESYASFGDMPRYLMDGVFFRDLAFDRPFGSVSQILDYTRLYYARYPALSLGHHPLLLPLLEAPLFALFGISVATARLVPLASFVAAVALLHLLVNELYGPLSAFLAALLLATSPSMAVFARSVMSEMPTVALILASAYFLHRFCVTERPRALVAFTVAAVLSLYAKQLAVLVLPAMAIDAASRLGFRRLLKRDVAWAVAAIVVLAAPLVPLSLAMSPSNIQGVLEALRPEDARTGFAALVRSALEPQLAWPVVLLAIVGAVRAIAVRDRRSVLFLAWVVCVAPALYVFSGAVAARYTVYWVPALCALAASAIWVGRRLVPVLVACLLLGAGLQALDAYRSDLAGAGGYEEAARFVLQADSGPTVLFSGDIDSGFFSFFIRKHDPARRLVVLRADKIFTTSYLARPDFEDRIDRPDEIYPTLHQFGVRYVVVEDRPSRSRVLEWLRRELRSPRFVERRRIQIGTSLVPLHGTSLVVYQYLDATPPAEHAELSMHLPIANQSVDVDLADLIGRKYLR